MPMLSGAQNRAMHAAAEGHSTLGIPKTVGADFVNASHGEKVSALPEYVQAQQGHKKKIRRGGRRRPPSSNASALHPAHVEAQGFLDKAKAATSPHVAAKHLFNALSALNKAKAATTPKV